MWRSIALLFGLLALVLGSEGNNYGCATGHCDQDGIFNFGNPDKSSMATNKPVVDNSEGVNGEPSKQATELSTTPASSSRFPSTTSIPDTTSIPGSSTASTATPTSSDHSSSSSSKLIPTTITPESTTSTKTLATTSRTSRTASMASTATTSASSSASTLMKTSTSSSSSSSSSSAKSSRRTSTSSDSTSPNSQTPSTHTLSTTSSVSTVSQEKWTTPIPLKTTSANTPIPTISYVSPETSSSRSSSTRTRSSLDSTGSSSASTGSSSTSSMITTPAALELTSTQSEEIPSSPEISTQTTPSLSSSRLRISELTTSLATSSASTPSAISSSSSSFSSSTSPSTDSGSDGMESSTSATSTTNKYTATLSKANEAFTSLEFGSTTLLKTTETPSSSSEPSTTEIFMKSTESSSSAFPSSEATSSSSSSMITTPTASELTSTLPDDPSSSSETRESSVTSSESTTRSFPSTTSESEASSEYHGTVLPSTYSTPITTGTRKPSIIMHSSTETSSVESSSSTFTETRKTKTSSPNTFKTTPTRSEKTTTGGNGVSTSSSITEPTISSTSKPRSSSSSVKSSGATDPATTGSLVSSTSRPRSSFPVKTSRTTKPADPHPSTMFFVRASSSSISKFTTKESTTTSQSVKLQTTDTEETMVSSTPPKVKPSTGGSTSTVVSTTDESPSTEGNSLTFSAEPQSSANPSTTVTLLTSADSSTEHPTTTDSTTSIVSESSSSENPSTAMQDGTTQISSKLSKATPTTIEPKSTEASTETTSSTTKTSPKITSIKSSVSSTTSTQSIPRSASTRETSKIIPQTSNTESSSSFKHTSSKQATKSSTTSTSKKSTPTNPSSASKKISTSRSTTTDPLHSQQCPDGHLIGTSYCFRLFPRLASYQSALAYCKTIDRQTLASLDKIKDNSDIKLIQESAALQNIDWIYANGIGSKDERFLKKASVYSIFNQSLVSSPIVKTVGISQLFTNISALCVMPQYGNTMDCNVEKIFQAYEFYNTFKQTAGILGPRRSGTVTCIYGNQKITTITCNALGAIYPNPTNIDCEESATERQLKDTTNHLVANCKTCYKRGTKECQKVLDETKQTVKGYQCICRKPYSMSTCWRTVNNCNSTVCGDHGTCMSEMGHMWCDCKWGYTGDHCEEALEKKYKGDIGFSTAAAATITVGDGIYRLLKICVMGLPKGDGGFDPQSTHQTFRWICILCANALIILYSNPTLLAIPLIQCRFTFIAIHFFYIQAMVQWLLEGFNVNQVLRCVHLNEWERDINGNKSLGVRIWPRFIGSVIGVAVFVLIPFTAGWNKLAASWTCVGVICEETLHVWFPIFFGVFVIVLWAGAIYENSALIKVRRPLLGFRLDYEIERRVGQEAGKVFQKCRDNELMCFIGVILLVAQWISVIISSDHRDEKFYGMISVVVSGIYSAFSTYQEMMTNPEDRATLYTLLQRFLPYRAAPAYNPETTWTIDEVKEYFNTPKKERDDKYEGFINRNQQLFIHHKWDIRMNEFLTEDPKMTINEALIKVFTAEMNELKENNGTGRDKLYIQATFVAYSDTIPHFEPRPAGKLQGHLQLVTLAAQDPVQGIRLAKFFIVPTHHLFEPEIPEKKKNAKQSRKKKNLRRRLLKNIEEDIFKLSCEEIHAQAVFANSAILFSHYGNNVVR